MIVVVLSRVSWFTLYMILMNRVLEMRAHEKHAPAPLLFSVKALPSFAREIAHCTISCKTDNFPSCHRGLARRRSSYCSYWCARGRALGRTHWLHLHRHQPRTRRDFLPRHSMHLSSTRHLLGSEHRLLSGFQAFGDSRRRDEKTECTLLW